MVVETHGRRLFLVVAFLLVGAALNVATAITCTLAAQQVPGLVTHTLNSTASDHRQANGRVADMHLWFRMERPGYKEFSFLTQTPDLNESALVVDIEAGWPWKSLRHFDRTELTNVKFMQQYLSFRNQPRIASADADGFLLPTRPILSGFVLNSLLYAAVLWVVFVGVPASRRYIRLRRGLCPRCGYPIGASDRCSECGAALPRAAAATHRHTPLESSHGSSADSQSKFAGAG